MSSVSEFHLHRMVGKSLRASLLPDLRVFTPFNSLVTQGCMQTWIELTPLLLPRQIAKRAFDFTFAICLGLLLLPFLFLISILIKLDSAGPVIFTQRRNGFNNRIFRIYKFRTLRTLEDGAVIKQVTHDDPRLTRIGWFLRRFSIDELPQLFNILKGEMSLVGPRPHAIAHNAQYGVSILNYAFRHRVKPGLTGWAQIHGLRGETRTLDAMQRRVDCDIWYIRHWSLSLDCKIVFCTIIEVLRQFFTDVSYRSLDSYQDNPFSNHKI